MQEVNIIVAIQERVNVMEPPPPRAHRSTRYDDTTYGTFKEEVEEVAAEEPSPTTNPSDYKDPDDKE